MNSYSRNSGQAGNQHTPRHYNSSGHQSQQQAGGRGSGRGSGGNTSNSILGGSKGANSASLISKQQKQKKQEATIARGSTIDYSLVAPIRQTASIFKQPVTVYKDHKSKVKAELKTVNKEKPSQLFWTRRLGHLTPVSYQAEEGDDEVEIMEPEPRCQVKLPKKVEVVGPGISEKMLLASISTHLHLSKDPAYGQKEAVEAIQKNPGAFINPAQPLMTSITVSDADIAAAENRVRLARQRLAQAIKLLA